MKHTLVMASILAAIVSTAASAAPPTTPPSETALPYMGNPAPAQLQVLAAWVGSWTFKTEVHSAAEPGRTEHFTGNVTGQWLLNGQFIRVDGRAANGKAREEYVVLFSYDVARAVYRRWYFSSIGLASEFEGHWNDAKKEMTWTLLHATDGRVGTLVDSVGPNAMTTKVVYQGADGKITRSATVSFARVP